MKHCVVGKSLPHTLSPEIHAALGDEDYCVRELASTEELGKFVAAREYGGLNVTIPYKRDVMPLLDFVDDEAAAVGAVNTVVNEGGKLKGYNTDVAGMIRALEHAKIQINRRQVLILGSGGTGHTANFVCKKLGAASVNTVSRTGKINYENCYELDGTQIVINATPVGMYPDMFACPIDLDRFERLEGVFDCIYNPTRTLLIQNALRRGVRAANGMLMLVEQGRLSHDLFAKAEGGELVPPRVSADIAERIEGSRSNIVLIGMAGAGKSSVGRALAEALDMKFADTDDEICKRTGRTIPDIFATDGEGEFRRLESEVVEEVCRKTRSVIATGGGAVTYAKNAYFMRATGFVVCLAREAKLLATSGRPLSKDLDSVRELLRQREPIYRQNADLYVENDGKLQDAVDKIAREARRRFIGGEAKKVT